MDLCILYQWGKEDGWKVGGPPMAEQPDKHGNLTLWVQERALFDPETH